MGCAPRQPPWFGLTCCPPAGMRRLVHQISFLYHRRLHLPLTFPLHQEKVGVSLVPTQHHQDRAAVHWRNRVAHPLIIPPPHTQLRQHDHIRCPQTPLPPQTAREPIPPSVCRSLSHHDALCAPPVAFPHCPTLSRHRRRCRLVPNKKQEKARAQQVG